jgi:hypothetical protein
LFAIFMLDQHVRGLLGIEVKDLGRAERRSYGGVRTGRPSRVPSDLRPLFLVLFSNKTLDHPFGFCYLATEGATQRRYRRFMGSLLKRPMNGLRRNTNEIELTCETIQKTHACRRTFSSYLQKLLVTILKVDDDNIRDVEPTAQVHAGVRIYSASRAQPHARKSILLDLYAPAAFNLLT